jgi:hypothetical protein
MTRICEKFIEEITSGSGTVSDELTQHLASCSACREAFESVRQLKTARKPITGKEAAAIAGILKAVSSGAAAPPAASSASAAGSGSMLLKPVDLALCVLSIIGVMLMQDKTPEAVSEKPTNGITTAIETKTDTVPAAAIDETSDLQDNIETASVSAAATMTENIVASGSLSDDSAQVEVSNGEAQTISISPDQEDIDPR